MNENKRVVELYKYLRDREEIIEMQPRHLDCEWYVTLDELCDDSTTSFARGMMDAIANAESYKVGNFG